MHHEITRGSRASFIVSREAGMKGGRVPAGCRHAKAKQSKAKHCEGDAGQIPSTRTYIHAPSQVALQGQMGGSLLPMIGV
jgi:hypothetical protein